MKTLKTLLAVGVLALPGAALAANVTVTFKNEHASQAATYHTTNSIESVTYANANPKPSNTVEAGDTIVFTVAQITSLVTTAQIRYKIGSKQCVFHTAFTGTPPSILGGGVIPNWTKSATPSGGATCTANITSANASTFDWTVTFTMK
ncbi:MAG: hypothetical protein LBE85_02420 [Candidatus Accumulibacter sp.]|jgi:hypothetical protein|nr:hypothetical protein [Accumulibacter sp.]